MTNRALTERTTFRFTEAERINLELLAAETGASQTDIMRRALREMRLRSNGYRDAVREILRLLEAHGNWITISPNLTGFGDLDSPDFIAKIEDVVVDEVYVIGRAVPPAEAPTGAADLVDLYLAAEPDLRLYVARIPARGTALTIPLSVLNPPSNEVLITGTNRLRAGLEAALKDEADPDEHLHP